MIDNDDQGIPDFLQRGTPANEWLENAAAPPRAESEPDPAIVDRGPGSVSRSHGYTDGVNHEFRTEIEMVEAAKDFHAKASLYAMVERKQTEKAEDEALKSKAREAQAEALANISSAPATKELKPKGNGSSKTSAVAGLLTRDGGCTTKDILEATGWPSVSVPAMAKAAGLSLRKVKEGKSTRYFGSK
jgi:hypothetical protein